MYDTAVKKVKSPVASEEEILAAIKGTLKPRKEKGDDQQSDLLRTGRNKMPVGRPKGLKTGLPIFLALCYQFQQNEKAPAKSKLTDQQLAEWMREEFPGRRTEYWDRIQDMRRYYNRGKFTRGKQPRIQSHRYDSGGTEIDTAYTRKK